MARQYIGARYVVKIYENSTNPNSAEWEANVNYEPLTMVTFRYGSYLSKKDVPATVGNPANFPAYWVQTGFYNGQIDDLNRQVRQLNSLIEAEVNNRMAGDAALSTRIDTLLTNLQEEVLNRQNADSALGTRIDTVSAGLASETTNRISADNNLQSQIDELIAPSGEAPSPAEITNARIGADDVTYDTLGNAIRTQVANANKLVSGYQQEEVGVYALPLNWEFGYYTSEGVKSSSSGWIRTNLMFKATDKYGYLDLGEEPTLKVTIRDLTAGETSGELSTSQYYTFTVGHTYFMNARLISSGTIDPSMGDDISIKFYPRYMLIGEAVTSSNCAEVLPDANNAPVNSIYRIAYTAGGTNYPAHLPDLTNEKAKQTFIATLETIAQNKNTAYYCLQKLTTFNSVYTRIKSLMTGDWSSWSNAQDTNCHQFVRQITDANIGALIPDLDNALPNAYYLMFISQGHEPLHSPELLSGYSVVIVHTYGMDNYRVQMWENRGNLYYRNYVNGTWTTWNNVLKPKSYVVGNDSSADYSSLVECIEEAIKYPNSTINVLAGEYDILTEYATLHPDDWETRNDGRGVNLQNNVTIIFNSGAKVVANYTGSNSNVQENFSVFNMRYGSATLVNAVIEASNIRYCIHDDFWTSAVNYHNKFDRCKMYIDNSENPIRSKYPHCVGGGFGQHGDVTIENCIFEGIGGDGISYDAPIDDSIVSYHNGPNESQYSKLVMTGCYFKGNGTFRAMSNGAETTKSDLLISNNSLGSAIIEGFTSGQTVPNMNVIAFNNEIRNS